MQRCAEALGQPADKMCLLARADFYRVQHLGRIHHMRQCGLLRQIGRDGQRFFAAQRPAQHATHECGGEQRGVAQRAWCAARGFHPQRFRHWLVECAIEQCMQLFVLARIGMHALGLGRIGSEIGLDRGAARGIQLPVDIGVQFSLRHRRIVFHFTLLNAGPAPFSCVRKRSRARDRRDITVPIGMPSVLATSS